MQSGEEGLDWKTIAVNFPGKNAMQCHLRYMNYLRPGLSFSPFTLEEDLCIAEECLKFKLNGKPSW